MLQAAIRQELLVWGVGLTIGLAVLVIVLGEAIERLQRQGNPLAGGLRQVRHIVLPILALMLVLHQVVGIGDTFEAIRIIETLFWLAVVYTGLTLMSNVIRFGKINPSAWVNKMPSLLFALIRATFVVLTVYYLLSGIWEIDISSLFTAVGVGALAISFALQDTLSNLVSGFLLLADRPFKVGDWVSVDQQIMQVKEITWRTTRLINYEDHGLVIIPNGELGQKTIVNYDQEGALFKNQLTVNFSYDDPPNKVKRVLTDLLLRLDGVVGEVEVEILNYGDFAITYGLEFCSEFLRSPIVQDQLRTRLYYTAKRHGLTFALPTAMHFSLDDRARARPVYAIEAMLRATPLLRSLDQETLERLATMTSVGHYGVGERIVRQGELDKGFYIIQEGAVRLSVTDPDGREHEIARLSTGDIFGELALLRDQPSPITSTVTEDVTVLIIDDMLIVMLLEQNPRFAMDMSIFIEEQKRAIAAIMGREGLVSRRNGQPSWSELIRRAEADA